MESIAQQERIIESDYLEQQMMHKLLLGQNYIAAQIHSFYPKSSCQNFAEKVLHHPNRGSYVIAPNISRTGTSFFDTVGQPARRKEYFNNSMPLMNLEYERFSFDTPLTAFMLKLMTVWPYGIQFQKLDGASMWAGSARVFDSIEALPHFDDLRVDGAEYPESVKVLRQLAVNIVVQTPNSGAEIDIWDLRLNEAEFDRLRLGDSYGLDRNLLPPPTVTIAPQVGDLILFDSTRIHALRPSDGVQIAHSCFLGFHGVQQPLAVWS